MTAEFKMQTKDGLVEIKAVMIDFEGCLEEGIDIFLDGEYINNYIGLLPEDFEDKSESYVRGFVEDSY